MCRNDEFYLKKWVEYYGRELGRENIFVFLDGKDQPVPDFCEGVSVTPCDKIPGKVVELDKRRSAFLSAVAADLLKRYDLVIGVDTDEFVVPDPALGLSLPEYLSQLDIKTSVSALGIDVGQDLRTEKDIDASEPFLSQRHYGLLGTRYTKPSVIARPVSWGSGFHRIKGHNFKIAKDLYLFHLGYFDMKRIQDRFKDKDRKAGGWSRHIAKRTETINTVSRKKASDWEKSVKRARVVMQLVRPPYAINKPAMFGVRIVVRIPERFEKIL